MNNENKTNINWYPGHMAKTKREIAEKLNLIDIVYEVIDARMPLSSKIVDIDDLIKDKPRVLVMTKYDLCDKTETDKFVKYYENLECLSYFVQLVVGLELSEDEDTLRMMEKFIKVELIRLIMALSDSNNK